MKKLALFCFFAIISLIGNAQNANWGDTLSLPAAHQPLLKDGKSWHYRKTQKVSEDLENLRVVVDTTYVNLTVRGDTIIDGQQCWKVYWETADTSYLHNIWLEDGMFVYVIDTEKGNMKNFVFNFTPKKGNHLKDWGLNWYLNTIDAVECWGQYYNRYHYRSTNGSEDGPLLVAGIGTFNGIENRTGAVGGWNSFLFLGCYEGDKLIFSQGDFFKACYRPFVEEGKVWKVGTISGNPVQVVDYYYFDGDTIINGKTCKQMMCQRYISPDYPDYDILSQKPSLSKVGAWYEEDMKVYCYDAEKQSMRMMYDFSLEANDTLQFLKMDGYPPLIIGPRQTGGLKGFKGVYRDIMMATDVGTRILCTPWLEGVGNIEGPTRNANYFEELDHVELLMSCTIGDEVIYLNDEYEDGATPDDTEAKKHRFDFTHTVKTQPRVPIKRVSEAQSLYGEYSNLRLGINLDPLDAAYQVRITNELGQVVYEKKINAGYIVALDIDISAYAEGRYTVTVENSHETFTGEFEMQTTGIEEVRNKHELVRGYIYNLQGQRISSLRKGLNIVNGKKIFVK